MQVFLMSSQMCFVVSGVVEGSAAIFTRTKQLTVVLFHMPREVALKRKIALALRAFERALSSVCSHVLINICTSCEKSCTNCTFVPFHTGMPQFVFAQTGRISEGAGTLLALEWTLA